ncbi:MAG: hypothetical protein ACE5EM_11375 [Sphingomonadales bacterium]
MVNPDKIVSMREALRRSLNVPAVAVLEPQGTGCGITIEIEGGMRPP